MHYATRRKFLKQSALLAGAFYFTRLTPVAKEKLLSFSTLGCPDWSFERIISFAATHGYKGIEVRGLQRQMDLPLCPEFSNAKNIASTLLLMKEKGLRFVGLGSSATLHFAEGEEREKNLEEGRRFIELAQKINCPYVRVFPNKFVEGQSRQATIELITRGLLELGEYAAKRNVTVLMETHGDLVWTDDIEKIMKAVNQKNVGLVWDVCNMWTITKEPVIEAFRRLKKYILHTHIKDAVLADGKPQYKLLGRGEVPIFEAIRLLDKGGYQGFYSFEWEKLWHPALDEPEIAFTDFPLAFKKNIVDQ